jgi:hypothetical protein
MNEVKKLAGAVFLFAQEMLDKLIDKYTAGYRGWDDISGGGVMSYSCASKANSYTIPGDCPFLNERIPYFRRSRLHKPTHPPRPKP